SPRQRGSTRPEIGQRWPVKRIIQELAAKRSRQCLPVSKGRYAQTQQGLTASPAQSTFAGQAFKRSWAQGVLRLLLNSSRSPWFCTINRSFLMLPRGSPRYRGWLGTRVCPSCSRADRTAVDGDRYNAAPESREPRPRSNTALPGSTRPELHKLHHCNKGGMDVLGKGVEPFAPGRERLWIDGVPHSREQECSSRPGCPLAPEPLPLGGHPPTKFGARALGHRTVRRQSQSCSSRRTRFEPR